MSKYNAKKAVFNNAQYDSRKEAKRAKELYLLERAGQISGLQRQVRYTLIPSQYINGKCVERGVTYVADFVYTQDGETIVEDVKGFKTPEYIIKRKLMLREHGIRIKEV